MKTKSMKPILLFLVITLTLSSLFYFLIIHSGKISGGSGLFSTGLMWSPGIAAIITCLILKLKISELGWQWGKTSIQIWNYSIPLLYAFVAYCIIWICGFGGFYNQDFIVLKAEAFGFKNISPSIMIVVYVLLTGTIGIIKSCANALGEEIGWRGFLVPRLFNNLGYTKTALLSGLIWSIWHYPILLFADYNNQTPMWYSLGCFTILTVSLGFTYTWMRIKSGSLWTSVLLHSSHNLFIQSVFTPLTKDTGNTKYFIDEFGIILPIITTFIAVYFWSRRKELIAQNLLNEF
jgi:membrane protease YdiL (CAAX protease family)